MNKEQKFLFQEVYFWDGDGIPKKIVQLLPVGKVQMKDYMTGLVSEFDSTFELCQGIVDNFKNNARGQKIPITDEHEDTEAYGWIADCYATSEGFFVIPDYNREGLETIREKKRGYASIEIIKNWLNPMTGITYGVVMAAVSLTNSPRIKNITGIIEGFSEGFQDKKKGLCLNSDTSENTSLKDIIQQLEDISLKLKSHPDLFNKAGSPQARALFSTALQNVKKYIPKEETQVPENIDTKKEEVKSISMSEFTSMKQEMELKFAEEVKKIKEHADEKVNVLEERLKLSEARSTALEAENHKKEDEMFLSELIRDRKLLPKDKESRRKELQAARKAGVVKFSETENYDYYSEAKERMKNSPSLVPDKVVGSNYTPPDSVEVSHVEVIQLAEKKMKENPRLSQTEATSQAIIETGYKFSK